MSGTEDHNKCAEIRVGIHRLTKHAFKRYQRDTCRISRNIMCKFVVVGFCQIVTSTFCAVSRGFELGTANPLPTKSAWDAVFPRSTCYIRIVRYDVTQPCSKMTPAPHCATLSKTWFESKRLLEPNLQGHLDTPPPEQQQFVALRFASVTNQAHQTELPSTTTA